jgi:hypothetical protein
MPGSSDVATVRIHNHGTTVAAFKVDVVGPACEWAEPPAELVRLFPGESATVAVKFTIPNRGGPRAGTLRVGVRAADVSTQHATVEEFDLQIASMALISAKLCPANSSGWRKGRHRIRIANQGNVDDAASVHAIDPDERSRCRVAPHVILPAGETVAVKLTIAPLRSRLFGRGEAHIFAVEIAPSIGPAVALRGSLRQRPLVGPAVALGVVAALVGVAVVAASGGDDPVSTAHDAAPAKVTSEPTSTPAPALSATTIASTAPPAPVQTDSAAPSSSISISVAGGPPSTAAPQKQQVPGAPQVQPVPTTLPDPPAPAAPAVTAPPIVAATVPVTVAAPVAPVAAPRHSPTTDFNGDGRTDVAIFRPSTGEWHVQGLGVVATFGGVSGDIPL